MLAQKEVFTFSNNRLVELQDIEQITKADRSAIDNMDLGIVRCMFIQKYDLMY